MKRKFTRGRKLFIILVSLFFVQGLRAQNPGLDEVNAQLRGYFGNLSRPSNRVLFLYDMTAHVTDSIWFSTSRHDTCNTDIWYKVYEEMYHSAYDTVPQMYPDTVFSRGNMFRGDTIPLGIMSYNFYKLKDDAMTTDHYFAFDTINDILSDIPRPEEPYLDSAMFLGSPLIGSSYFRNPVFHIDPAYFFSDAANMIHEGRAFKVDFGDGNGWIPFDMTTATNYTVTYRDSGNYVIRMGVFEIGSGNQIRETAARFNVTHATLNIPPDDVFHFSGITAGLYIGCNNRGITGKTVIMLEGIDLLDMIPGLDKTVNEIYSEMIETEDMVELRNQGYNFLVVSWDNSRIDLRFNALYTVNMIEQLKCMIGDDNEQFVVMGVSMGGLVGRYALTYMETDMYDHNVVDPFFQDAFDPNNIVYLATHSEIFTLLRAEKCHPEKRHNTRLFVTLDAPHQGANIPISTQKLYRHVMNVFGPVIGVGIKAVAGAFNIALDGQAAQQMLIYHIDTEHGSSWYKQYDSHEDKYRFFEQLRSLGNYPRFAKVTLMSNGDLAGSNQQNWHEAFLAQPRIGGDKLLDFKLDTYCRILWFKVPVFGGNLDVRTNPNGQGRVLRANAGTFGIRIKLKWFGIRIHIGYNSLLFIDDDADVRPYCTSAGSHVGVSATPFGQSAQVVSSSNNSQWFVNSWIYDLGLFHYNLWSDGRGCLKFDSHLGLNGFASANIDAALCSDGMQFCFIPTASALDYGDLQHQELNLNIAAHDINYKFTQTPADVIIGYLDERNELTPVNHGHLDYRNDRIFNITRRVTPQDPSTRLETTHSFFSCNDAWLSGLPNAQLPQRSLLSLEVGDEELYLENVTLPWRARYTSEYDIRVNVRNPLYEYRSQPFTGFPMLAGTYSRQDNYDLRGFAEFQFDPHSPSTIGFEFQNPNGTWAEIPQPIDICCRRLNTTFRGLSPSFVKQLESKPSYFKLFPNPNNGVLTKLKYRFAQNGKVRVEIINVSGQRMWQQILATPDATMENTSVVLLPQSLNKGLYFVRITNGKEVQTSKLILTK